MAARALITLRVAPAGLDKIDRIATDLGSNRSEVIRLLLGEALKSPAIVKAVRTRLGWRSDT